MSELEVHYLGRTKDTARSLERPPVRNPKTAGCWTVDSTVF